MALPLAMAFGIASGVTPQAGLYTAIVGGFLAALLGGVRVQVSGPTGAFVVIVAGIIHDHGLSGLLMVTMMAGVMLLVLGFTGLGTAVKFIPRPVVLGFHQRHRAADRLDADQGLPRPRSRAVAKRVLRARGAIAQSLPTFNPSAVALGVVALAIIVLLPRWLPKVPGSIVALPAGTAAVALLDLPVATIGTTFGGIPSGLPPVSVPAFRADLILPLLQPAFTVAVLAALESLLSAVVADSMTGDRHNSNAELVAQGVANIVVPMVGGIPVTGAIARTATNIRAGARTPVASVDSRDDAAAGRAAAGAAGGEHPAGGAGGGALRRGVEHGRVARDSGILRLEAADIAVWMITFALTVMADLTIAVEAGLALAALLYIYRVTETTSVSVATPEYIAAGEVHSLQGKEVPPYVTILRIHGPFLFGTTDKLNDVAAGIDALQPDRHPATAQHDRHRRHGAARAGALLGSAAALRPDAAGVRGAAPAREVPGEGRVRRGDRAREHRAARRSGARPGARARAAIDADDTGLRRQDVSADCADYAGFDGLRFGWHPHARRHQTPADRGGRPRSGLAGSSA